MPGYIGRPGPPAQGRIGEAIWFQWRGRWCPGIIVASREREKTLEIRSGAYECTRKRSNVYARSDLTSPEKYDMIGR